MKFTSKIHKVKKKSSKKDLIDKLASFANIPPPIPAKTLKEVNEILKYFKKNNQYKDKNKIKKLYVQALLFSSNVKEILKKPFQIFKPRKSKISRKSSNIMVKPNHILI